MDLEETEELQEADLVAVLTEVPLEEAEEVEEVSVNLLLPEARL